MTGASEIMSAPVYAVSPKDNVARARNLMLRYGVSRLVVAEGDDLKGIVTKKDIGKRLSQAEPQWRRRPIDQIPVDIVATHKVITAKPDAPVHDVASTMLSHGISGIVVYDKGILGIVTKHDMVKYFTLVGCPLRVGDMMSEKVVTVSRHHTINSVIEIMEENGVDRVIVRNGGPLTAYVGMITLDDLGFASMDFRDVKPIKEAHRAVRAGPKKLRGVREAMMVAEDVMSVPLVSVDKNAMAVEAAKTMLEHNYDMLPVIDGELLGEFSVESIIRWLSEALE
ncbi:putative signal-transduction protein [Methanocella conradii HZ254]|uniref:Signal-transduction protein n=1 Tax=Methanocella conradii (strain DSM 24694 / JCM 17849 / CGMCC 1.5162 / HZ254) TaxID=1041930 RepID=H8I8G3_METCZ|nr:CBS domain-containing protein [Methanocella conradii]AFC99439.1 putative signal-transduction protein [Methanocella conradii HZ254]MDI6897995.1 CBS domain-containing protein [Methanocella conradii]